MHGIIVMWSGDFDNIPPGWALCDGTQGTPDLHGRFILAAYSGIQPHVKGGANSHKHNIYTSGAYTDLQSGDELVDAAPAGDYKATTEIGLHLHGESLVSNKPVFYSLCFIMKL